MAFERISNGKKPNIILIMADDFGYECLSCNGSTSYKTPVLDNLAQTGVRFLSCYATPLCTPSRVQIMTGKYNFRNYTEFGSLKPGERTFAHYLRDAGYTTCVAGKWQLAGHYRGSNYRGIGTLPDKADFDEHCLWQVKELGNRYWDPRIQQNGQIRRDLQKKYGPDVMADFIIDFIERNRSKRFFVYYPMILTHDPFMQTPDSQDRSGNRTRRDKAFFPDMVVYADKIVGRIVESLDKLGLRDKTILLFTGDNGSPRGISSEMGQKVIKGGKGYTTEAGTHVPLIANWKGTIPAGQTCEDLIDFTDFLPSFLQISGAEFLLEPVLDGRSFVPQLLGKKGNPRDWIFCHYEPKWGKWKLKRYAQSKKWKLYSNGQIFDIQSDPDELYPVSLDRLNEKNAGGIQMLQKVLDTMK
ncbi:MAG: sulfatase-like hydrolase/transferase [Candidatus Aminicenantes bacterium]|nr:MAG: sulfatase-like hydrolase/transferase [Candidatus Aminicenantes bacterium]